MTNILLRHCACGHCDELISETDRYGRPHIFKHGHNGFGKKYMLGRKFSEEHKRNLSRALSGKSHPWTTKEIVKVRTSRQRAVNILKKEGRYNKCVIADLNCLGKFDVHHIDKNPFNNESKNLACLCKSHHKLADLRNLSIEELKNLEDIRKKRRHKVSN